MALKNARVEMAKFALLASAAFFVLVPFWVMISISLKDLRQFLDNILYPYYPFQWQNYVAGWEAVSPYILNTLIVAVVVTVVSLTMSSMTAYVFARYNFRGKTALFYSLLVLLMIPGILNLIPQYVLALRLGLVGTAWALILFYIASRQVLEVFVLRTFFLGVPKELFEAAEIDGASDIRQYWSIALPLSKSILGTLAIMTVVFVWNDYIWPLVAADSFKTVSIGLAYLTKQHSTSWGPLMAGYAVASFPLILLFSFTMRYFVEGIATGAIKA
jgi:multiple sugar transport system permease protein/raffinose/stachyose/melibiose transport system permease protein